MQRTIRAHTLLAILFLSVALVSTLFAGPVDRRADDVDGKYDPVDLNFETQREQQGGLADLLGTAIRSSEFLFGNGAQVTLFTGPPNQRTFVTSINICCALNQMVTIEIDGATVLVLGMGPTLWSTGGGAPLILEPNETMTARTEPGLIESVQVTATAFRFSDCPEDINGDGVVDVQDLLQLLSAWGSCP
jgi:hypothetical protein